jgi:hypothetical protein
MNKDYIVVKALEITELEEKVNSKLEEGYTLVGGLTATNISSYDITLQYCQAMVKG